MKKYIVRLSQEEQERLKTLTKKGKVSAYKIRHASILLEADLNGPGRTDVEIAKIFRCHVKTIEDIRKRFVEKGLDSALNRKEQDNPRRAIKLDGEKEAQLIAMSCGKPPEGAGRWTLKLLKDNLIALEIVDTVSIETVRKTLKKNELRPHLRKCWCIPPEQEAEFVACMEDVLDLYCLPHDPEVPRVNKDEQPMQLLKETRTPIPPEPGQPGRYDFEYERMGTAVNFMFTEPLAGWRKVNVRERRTSVDWAQEIKELLDIDYPGARKVILICDNLNTHKVASLYEAFPAEEARRLAQRLEIHYTPKHGSWLNVAEIELSVLTKQCLSGRNPDIQTVRSESRAWYSKRNAQQKGVDWQFTTDDARIKLKRLYPKIQN